MVISSSLGIGIGIGVRFSNPILIGAPKMQRSRPLVRAGAGKWGVSDDVLARLSSELSEEYLASRRVPTPPKLWHKREQLGMNGDGGHFRYRCPNVNHFRVFLKPLTSTGSTSVDVDLIIRYYIQTLSQLLGSEEEAVKRIYSVATNEYYAFGANISAKLADIMIALPNVCNIHPDEYVDRREKRFPYPWYPFINGQVLPYDRSDFLNYRSHGLGMARL